MAKSKSSAGSVPIVTIEFPRTGNPWTDAGTVGIYRVLNRKASYVDPPADLDLDPARTSHFPDVEMDGLQADRFVIKGPADQVQACLEAAYDRLVSIYFNVSSKKQKEEKGTYNFYYRRFDQKFITFAKKKASGAALLLFDKAARPSQDQVEWGTAPDARGKSVRTAGRMPPDYAHLQEKLDEFLSREGLKPGPPAGLLIDGPNQVRPKVEIRVSDHSAKPKSSCFLSGDPGSTFVEAKETAFPLLGGSRSFINGVADWPRMGWKMDFVGKFVPAVSFFYIQGEDIHVFFPESTNLRRVDALADMLAGMVQLEPNLFRNFELLLSQPKLRPFFQRRSEVALGFLYTVFVKLSEHQATPIATKQGDSAAGPRLVSLDDEPETPEGSEEPEEEPISIDAIFGALQREGATSFTVVSASKKGNVWMARDFTTFRDIERLARLFARMQRRIQMKDGRGRYECDPKKLMAALIDFEAKAESRTLLRDKVCESILQGASVLPLLERHAFHINPHADTSQARSVGPLLEFARLYEPELRKGTDMEEPYSQMVKTATWLGDLIGKALAQAVLGRSDDQAEEGQAREAAQKESPGRAKGGLFRLRKTRTIADFVNELARLQFRYKIDVPKEVLDGDTFCPDLFEEFRGFCVVAALNRFQYLTRKRTQASNTTN
jgi:hypothetical protein